jgi:hypothetical protein
MRARIDRAVKTAPKEVASKPSGDPAPNEEKIEVGKMTVPKGANPLMDFGFGPAPTKDAKEPEHKKKEKTPYETETAVAAADAREGLGRFVGRRRTMRTGTKSPTSSPKQTRLPKPKPSQNQNRSAGVVVGGDAFGFEEDHGGYVHRSPPPGDGHGARVVARAAQTEAPERGQGRVEADG